MACWVTAPLRRPRTFALRGQAEPIKENPVTDDRKIAGGEPAKETLSPDDMISLSYTRLWPLLFCHFHNPRFVYELQVYLSRKS
jgi:hypothetical protein